VLLSGAIIENRILLKMVLRMKEATLRKNAKSGHPKRFKYDLRTNNDPPILLPPGLFNLNPSSRSCASLTAWCVYHQSTALAVLGNGITRQAVGLARIITIRSRPGEPHGRSSILQRVKEEAKAERAFVVMPSARKMIFWMSGDGYGSIPTKLGTLSTTS